MPDSVLECKKQQDKEMFDVKQTTAKQNSAGKRYIKIVLLTALALFLCQRIIGAHSGPLRSGDNPNSSSSPAVISSGGLYSMNAILVCLDDNTVLMEKNSRQRIYPASLTKIMTALVAIEQISDLQVDVNLPAEGFAGLYTEDASMAGFKPNEKVKAIDLIYGILLPSGAECCQGIACHVAGSESWFVQLMNEKAARIGMHDTHFANSTGLHQEDHYTTVQDLAILLRYALQDDTFRTVFSASRHFTQSTSIHPDGISFSSTLFDNMNNPGVNGGSIVGGKTGYTEEAGLCLASLAQIDAKEYILVTAGANGNHETEQYNIIDAFAIYNRISR